MGRTECLKGRTATCKVGTVDPDSNQPTVKEHFLSNLKDLNMVRISNDTKELWVILLGV